MYSAQLSQSCFLHGDSISSFLPPQSSDWHAFTSGFVERAFLESSMAWLGEVDAKLHLME